MLMDAPISFEEIQVSDKRRKNRGIFTRLLDSEKQNIIASIIIVSSVNL